MEQSRKNIIIGFTSLLISAPLQAYFSCSYKKAWIILAFIIVYAIIFLKYLKEDAVVDFLNKKYGKKTLKTMGIITLAVGFSLMPELLGEQLTGVVEFVAYMVSYVCWMSGLLLIDVAR